MNENSAAPTSGDVPDAGILRIQEVVPWAEPFTDLDPFNLEEDQPPPLPFGLEPKRENACREAAKSSEGDWGLFCSSLLKRRWGDVLNAKCMGYLNKSTTERTNFCGWLEIPYYNPQGA